MPTNTNLQELYRRRYCTVKLFETVNSTQKHAEHNLQKCHSFFPIQIYMYCFLCNKGQQYSYRTLSSCRNNQDDFMNKFSGFQAIKAKPCFLQDFTEENVTMPCREHHCIHSRTSWHNTYIRDGVVPSFITYLKLRFLKWKWTSTIPVVFTLVLRISCSVGM